MKKFYLLILIIIFVVNANANANDGRLKKIYIDKSKNVNVISFDGKKTKLTHHGRATRAALSEDNRTAAWLLQHNWIAEGDRLPGASKLYVYRNGKTKMIECNPFIREYWFWEDGKKVGIDCGGRHFAGTLSLYDVRTGKELESFDQPDIPENKRPAWSLPGSNYEPEKIH